MVSSADGDQVEAADEFSLMPEQGMGSGEHRTLLGSFAQRYVKRHAPVRERAETRRLR
jgi:hypothetical protein